MLVCEPDTFPILQRLLAPYRAAVEGALWDVLESEPAKADEKDQKLPAACFLAEAATRSVDAAAKWKKSATLVADQMVEKLLKEPRHFERVVEALGPASTQLLDPLMTIYRKPDPKDRNAGAKRLLARSILATYFIANPEIMATVFADNDDPDFYTDALDKLPEGGRPLIKPMIDQLRQSLGPRPDLKVRAGRRMRSAQ